MSRQLRWAAFTGGLAVLLVIAAAWTARSRAPTFESLGDYEVITCELAEPLDGEGWIDFGIVQERGRAVARGNTLFLQLPRRYFVALDGTVVVAGEAAVVRIEPWQASWGATQRCADVVTLLPANRVDFEVTNASGPTVLYACDQKTLVVGGHATVWVPPVGRAWGPTCVAWATRWDGAESVGGGPFRPDETHLVRLELPAAGGGGIGAVALGDRLDVWPGGPAWQAGLRSGDRLVAIDGVPVPIDLGEAMDFTDERLPGPEGSTVQLEVRDTETGPSRTITLERVVMLAPGFP